MSDEHNEQLLWFMRRTVELEELLRKMTEQFNERAAEAIRERGLADELADQLRVIARNVVPYAVVQTNFHAREEGDPPKVTRFNGRKVAFDDGTELVLLWPEGSIGYAKSPLEKWREARWRRFQRMHEVVAPEQEQWP